MIAEKYPFIKGLELSRLLYEQAVKPILDDIFPQMEYSAALLGPGSDVLGYDTEQSMDHDWGPRLLLFLSPQDFDKYKDSLSKILRYRLPRSIHCIPTDLAKRRSSDPQENTPLSEHEINHSILLLITRQYFHSILDFNPIENIRVIDWVSTPSTTLLGLTSGEVFYDGLNELIPIRERLKFYPDDVWLYLLAAQWMRISQEEHFMGRCGQVGDDVGSRIIASRLVHDLMHLCFLMERRYAPYIKWFGTAFNILACADDFKPALTQILKAETWQEREKALTLAYELAAVKHNALAITEPLGTKVSSFYLRPFNVIHGERFVNAILERISDEEVLALPKYLGSIDQFTDSTDALNQFRIIKRIYE